MGPTALRGIWATGDTLTKVESQVFNLTILVAARIEPQTFWLPGQRVTTRPRLSRWSDHALKQSNALMPNEWSSPFWRSRTLYYTWGLGSWIGNWIDYLLICNSSKWTTSIPFVKLKYNYSRDPFYQRPENEVYLHQAYGFIFYRFPAYNRPPMLMMEIEIQNW